MTPLLAVESLSVTYGEARAVFDVSFQLEEGRVLCVLGANGAGKSSLAAAIAGVLRPAGGRVRFAGADITGWPAHRVARAGIAYLPEGRGIFPHLSVADNLRAMLRYGVPRAERAAAVKRVLAAFPALVERQRQPAGTLSGGEQQMLALARVMATRPRLVIADELSLGLAPRLVDAVFAALARARAEGTTILLIEQYVDRAVALADEALVMRRGRVAWQGPANQARTEALSGYLGEQ